MNLELINQQIRDIQRRLTSDDLSEPERISLYDTLTFLLDTRALVLIRGDKGEESNDLYN